MYRVNRVLLQHTLGGKTAKVLYSLHNNNRQQSTIALRRRTIIGGAQSIAKHEDEASITVSSVLDPTYESLRSIVVNHHGGVDVRIELTTGCAPGKKMVTEKVTNALDSLLASCKGGVGKSTIATNLAYALAASGSHGRVGLLDADIYGPSLPSLVPIPEHSLPIIRKDYPDGSKLLQPLTVNGVSLMSYGYVSSKASVLRGPRVSSIVNQLVSGTKWGSLDYLVIDMPPGTGDVQLTLCQKLSLTASVVVTTPQELSYVDVIKGLDMFQTLDVPVAAVVENMSHFDTPDERICKHEHLRNSQKNNDICDVFTLPISTSLSPSNNHSTSKDKDNTNHILGKDSPTNEFYSLAKSVVQFCSNLPEFLRFLSGFRAGQEHVVSAELLKSASRDAQSTDGNIEITKNKNSLEIKPIKIQSEGNYAISINWNDGHKSAIYTHQQIIELAEKQ
eukprot:GSMAST32.ASY1.ANO1.1210.1 assembled CDS